MCESCAAVSINGINCHEYGCPDTPVGTCDNCLDPIKRSEQYTNQSSDWTGFRFCSESCADEDIG